MRVTDRRPTERLGLSWAFSSDELDALIEVLEMQTYDLNMYERAALAKLRGAR